MNLEVLYHDNHLLVVNKPAGVPAVPDASGDAALLDAAKGWVKQRYEKPGDVFLGVVHRLDRPVSGVVVFARTSKAAARLSEAWRTRRVRKVYWGLVEGRPRQGQGSGELEQYLRKDERRNLVTAARSPREGKLARTRWRVLADLGGRSLLELEPLTGRPHQLRAACAALGCPLVGDLKYGARAPLPDASIALHARELEFPHPTQDEVVRIRAAPPESAWWKPAAPWLG
ncbi:MAG: RluA family pseudouridine synthase [Planctomycetota bacterium]|nr:MAG: RluA family pseudouridine synthase [Planctomycetota bacterium]